MEHVPCPRCKGQLLPSGYEPHRRICEGCGQHYHAVLQYVPVDAPPNRDLLLPKPGDDAS